MANDVGARRGWLGGPFFALQFLEASPDRLEIVGGAGSWHGSLLLRN
jgi:hypothetical protein